MPVDEQVFFALVRNDRTGALIDGFRQTGDARLKRKLPAFIFQATFDESVSKAGTTGRWRKQAATRLTGLVVMDIDHVDNPRESFGQWRRQDFGRLGILLVYVTPSGHGLKVVAKADARRGNLIDNQHALAEVLGVEVDESCKDASRMSFVCKEEDILYLDKELFCYEGREFAEKYDAEYRAGRSSSDKPNTAAESQRGRTTSDPGRQPAFRGIPYSAIIEEWWRQQGGVPAEGERNTGLHRLAVHLRTICDNSQPLLLAVMPRLGLDETEMRGIIASATKEQPKGRTREMRAVLRALGLTDTTPDAGETEGDIGQRLRQWGAQIEALQGDFPLLRDICKGLKKSQYPAALFVGGGLLMTLMTRCTYRFYHRPEELRRLNNSTLIIGDPASGKSFATRLYKLLMAPVAEADKKGKEAINAYREQMKTKGANKEKPPKPKAVVRIHPARTSNAQFIQDMVNAVETVDGQEMQLHMLTFDTELDNTLSIQRGGSWIDKNSLELKAFHNEEDGQAYSNVDSVMQNFNVTWNFIYTGTPIALRKKVSVQNFGSGLATRLTCIPLPATNFEMMKRENDIDEESDERLRQWAVRLDKTKGELSVGRIVDGLYEWTARRMADAKENDSKADEMLLKRCAYHGLNFAAPFIVTRHWEQLHEEGGYRCGTFETDEADWRLAELIVNIQFACQRHYFGAMAEAYFDDQRRDMAASVQRRPKTLEGFSRLPEEFTIEDVTRCFSLTSDHTARNKVARLMADKLVEIAGNFNDNGRAKKIYRKTGNMMP